jgi:hypothetical protein
VDATTLLILSSKKKEHPVNTYATSDLALAAFLKMRGKKLVSAGKSRTGKFTFEFEDEGGACQSLALEFVNGEFSAYDAQVRALKKALYGS